MSKNSKKISGNNSRTECELGNTKPIRDTRAKSYAFTWNNFLEEDIENIVNYFVSLNSKYVIGREIGENETPHLQGYFCAKNQVRFSTLKNKFPKVHWEKAKGNLKQNYNYCTKDGNFITNIETEENFREKLKNECLIEYKNVVWKHWQQEIIDTCNEVADNRTINWYWEPDGNSGKSFLAKYLCITKNVVIAEGKKNDVFNQINTCIMQGRKPEIIILDIPRYNLEYINYGLIEQVKNGCVYSGKYEGGMCIFKSPHIFIFANEEPDIDKMSLDRWNIVRIGEEEEKKEIKQEIDILL